MIIRYMTYREDGMMVAEAKVCLSHRPTPVRIVSTHHWLAVEKLRLKVYLLLSKQTSPRYGSSVVPCSVRFVRVGGRRMCGLCKCKLDCPCDCHKRHKRHKKGGHHA